MLFTHATLFLLHVRRRNASASRPLSLRRCSLHPLLRLSRVLLPHPLLLLQHVHLVCQGVGQGVCQGVLSVLVVLGQGVGQGVRVLQAPREHALAIQLSQHALAEQQRHNQHALAKHTHDIVATTAGALGILTFEDLKLVALTSVDLRMRLMQLLGSVTGASAAAMMSDLSSFTTSRKGGKSTASSFSPSSPVLRLLAGHVCEAIMSLFGAGVLAKSPATPPKALEALLKKERVYILPGDSDDPAKNAKAMAREIIQAMDVGGKQKLTKAAFCLNWNSFATKWFKVREDGPLDCCIM